MSLHRPRAPQSWRATCTPERLPLTPVMLAQPASSELFIHPRAARRPACRRSWVWDAILDDRSPQAREIIAHMDALSMTVHPRVSAYLAKLIFLVGLVAAVSAALPSVRIAPLVLPPPARSHSGPGARCAGARRSRGDGGLRKARPSGPASRPPAAQPRPERGAPAEGNGLTTDDGQHQARAANTPQMPLTPGISWTG